MNDRIRTVNSLYVGGDALAPRFALFTFTQPIVHRER